MAAAFFLKPSCYNSDPCIDDNRPFILAKKTDQKYINILIGLWF